MSGKTRFTLGKDGIFRDRHGVALGRISAITIDFEDDDWPATSPASGRPRVGEIPQDVTFALWKRADGKCEHCREAKPGLERHHVTYERLGGDELLEDLLLLCRECHQAEHDRLADAGTPLVRPRGGKGGGVVSSSGEQPSVNSKEGVGTGGAGGGEIDQVRELWSYYVGLFGKSSTYRLDSTRTTVIRQALKVRDLQTCKWAVYGLRHSPWHRGENPERKRYDDIRYALKGKPREGESNEERIDRMAALGRERVAAARGVHSPSSPHDDARVKRRVEELRQHAQSGRSWEPQRAAQARADLERWGYVVELLDVAPWVRLERKS